MRLRKLKRKDAPGMLEWMHDPTVVEDLKTNFLEKTMKDCEEFIEAAQSTVDNIHLAIVDENDIYMGTVSLKHILNGSAEFGITVRTEAMGCGYSQYAMKEMLCIGFEQLKLNRIYWCVSPDNRRAVRFYEKNHYKRMEMPPSDIRGERYSAEEIKLYLWYQVER